MTTHKQNPFRDRPFGQARPDYVDADTRGVLFLWCGECHHTVDDFGVCGCAKKYIRQAWLDEQMEGAP